MTGYRLFDKLELYPGLYSYRSLLVYASSRQAADVTARIHHAAILHSLGVI